MWFADVKHDATQLGEAGLFTCAHKARFVCCSPRERAAAMRASV